MKRCWLLVLCCAPALAAITGTVVNRTTGKPQGGLSVGYFKVGNGLELAGQAQAGADGAFSIDYTPQGPGVLRATVDGVTYTQMIPPGTPTTGLTFNVYSASSQPGASKVTKHMILFQPSGGQMDIKETYLLGNDGQVSWNDSRNGTLHFYLPVAAGGKATVNATAPGSMSIGAELVKTSQTDVYGVDFAIKPGETRIDLDYSLPYTEGAPYQSKIVTKDENTYLIAPNGVTLTGDHLNDLGVEPQSQAHIYGLVGSAYQIALSGSPVATPQDNAAEGAGEADGSPQVEPVSPHLAGQAPLILGLALGVLALGFAILYRAGPGAPGEPRPAGKETNARGRR